MSGHPEATRPTRQRQTSAASRPRWSGGVRVGPLSRGPVRESWMVLVAFLVQRRLSGGRIGLIVTKHI